MLKLFAAAATMLTVLLGGPATNKPGIDKHSPSISTENHCSLVYAPVICHHKIYTNQCIADENHAKSCVPLGN